MIFFPSGRALQRCLPALLAAALCLGGARSGPQAVPGHSIQIIMTVDGRYRVTQNAGSVAGRYAFTVRWKGRIERDDEDWRLVHESCDLLDWQAEETPAPQSKGQVLTTGDFADKPAFHFGYVLEEEGLLELDFSVTGFPVPLNPSLHKFPLILPVSAGTTLAGADPGYDKFVTQGSNLVQAPVVDLLDGPLERTYSWSWSHYQTTLAQQATAHCYQTHRARLTVAFNPPPER
jgi:hypothetical protein